MTQEEIELWRWEALDKDGTVYAQIVNPYDSEENELEWYDQAKYCLKYRMLAPTLTAGRQYDGKDLELDYQECYGGVWANIYIDEYKHLYSKGLSIVRQVLRLKQSQEEEYTYTIDGKPCTKNQYHDTKFASAFMEGVGNPERHSGQQQKVEKPTIQQVLDWLHSNVSASIVYEDFHDFSKGIKGAEVDYFPETETELFHEMRANWQQSQSIEPMVDKWVSDRLPDVGEDYNVVLDLKDGGKPVSGIMEWDGLGKRWVYPGIDVTCDCVTHWQPLPEPPQTTTH